MQDVKFSEKPLGMFFVADTLWLLQIPLGSFDISYWGRYFIQNMWRTAPDKKTRLITSLEDTLVDVAKGESLYVLVSKGWDALEVYSIAPDNWDEKHLIDNIAVPAVDARIVVSSAEVPYLIYIRDDYTIFLRKCRTGQEIYIGRGHGMDVSVENDIIYVVFRLVDEERESTYTVYGWYDMTSGYISNLKRLGTYTGTNIPGIWKGYLVCHSAENGELVFHQLLPDGNWVHGGIPKNVLKYQGRVNIGVSPDEKYIYVLYWDQNFNLTFEKIPYFPHVSVLSPSVYDHNCRHWRIGYPLRISWEVYKSIAPICSCVVYLHNLNAIPEGDIKRIGVVPVKDNTSPFDTLSLAFTWVPDEDPG